MTEPGRLRPCPELLEILAPAFEPCRHFKGACAGIARWDPVVGHIPRGFKGALGTLDEIELVLVVAEPGDTWATEFFDSESSPTEYIERITEYSFPTMEMRDAFSMNLRRILDDCWPGLSLHDQFRRTWITESYLCSAPRESGPVPRQSWSVCGRDYLAPQLSLLSDRAIVACGVKAQQRIEALGFKSFLPVPAIAPPEGNKPRAREMHRKIPEYLALRRDLRGRQMTPTDVVAIEVKQYVDADGRHQTIAPRLIGNTEAAKRTRHPRSASSALTDRSGLHAALAQRDPQELEAAEALLDWADEHPDLRVNMNRAADICLSSHTPGLLRIWGQGRHEGNLEIKVDTIRKFYPDWDDDDRVEQLMRRIEEIGGVRLRGTRMKWPLTPLAALADPAKRKAFIDIIEQVVAGLPTTDP